MFFTYVLLVGFQLVVAGIEAEVGDFRTVADTGVGKDSLVLETGVGEVPLVLTRYNQLGLGFHKQEVVFQTFFEIFPSNQLAFQKVTNCKSA